MPKLRPVTFFTMEEKREFKEPNSFQQPYFLGFSPAVSIDQFDFLLGTPWCYCSVLCAGGHRLQMVALVRGQKLPSFGSWEQEKTWYFKGVSTFTLPQSLIRGMYVCLLDEKENWTAGFRCIKLMKCYLQLAVTPSVIVFPATFPTSALVAYNLQRF